MRVLLLVALCAAAAGSAPPGFVQERRGAMLHAHNCYPEQGQWVDRLERAIGTGLMPIAIEQDVVWAPGPGGGRSVVSHEAKTTGGEPSLEAHFFERMTPLIEAALQENRRERWPLYVLHLDFKTNEPEHHRFVWDLLGKYERWLTTAPRVADERDRQPLSPGPVLVLTENGEGQAAAFHDRVPVGGRLRVFGTVPSAVHAPSNDREAQIEAVFAAPVATLIPGRATNYRRWTNFSWAAVERGGQARAGAWTADDEARLKAIVDRAHAMGLRVRFYTLNGHPPGGGDGWTESYNFGSLEAVRPRWRAAIGAGVDFIATDQYEEFAAMLRRQQLLD